MARILLIPGLICDRHVWQGCIDALAGHDVAVADASTQTSLTDMAEDLLAGHPGDLIVVGHSMGGRVAMEMARIAPDWLFGLALLNTGMAPLKEGELPKREAIIAFAHDKGMAALADHWLPGMMAAGITPDPSVMAGLRAMVCRMSAAQHERQIRALIGRPDAALSLGAWTGPMLLITGRQDIWSPIAQHEEIAQLCPQAHLEIIEEAGHFAPVEQPEKVATLVSDWARAIVAHAEEK